MFTIEFYRKENGDCPVETFLDSLQGKLAVKAVQELYLLQEKGPSLREPYSKHLMQGLFELRIQQSRNAARIFYFFFKDSRIVVTNGFIKKSRKTPMREMQAALSYMNDWKARNEYE